MEQSNYRECAAAACWVLITVLDRFETFFAEHADEFEHATFHLNQGLYRSEAGDDEDAYRHFKLALGRIIAKYRFLITEDEDILDRISHLAAIDREYQGSPFAPK